MEKLISAAKNAKKEIDKKNNPLSVIFKEPNDIVEFAEWKRIAYIKCNQRISSYEDFLKNVTLESINILKKNDTKEKIFKESKFIDINNDANKLFSKIVSDFENGNVIKIKSNLAGNNLNKHKFIIDYDHIDYDKINNEGVTETNNDIINDSTIDNIKKEKKNIKWFSFMKRYKGNISKFKEEYGCNINDSANVDDQDDDTSSGGSGVYYGGYNKYLKNKKKSKRKKNKVKKGGFHQGYFPVAATTYLPMSASMQSMPQLGMSGMPGAPMQVGAPMGVSRPMPQPMPVMIPSMPQPGMPGAPMQMGAPMGVFQPMHQPGMPWIPGMQGIIGDPMPNQNSQPQNQTEKYQGIEDHKEAILIIKNDKKKRIEFYQPIDIKKVKRLKLIVDSKSDREKKALKEASRERLEKIDGIEKKDLSNSKKFNLGILVQSGGNLTLDDIKDAIKYTPIPAFSLRTEVVENGLWNFDKYHPNNDGYDIIYHKNNTETSFEPLKDYLTKTFEKIKKIKEDSIKSIKSIKDKKEYFDQELNFTDYIDIKDLENKRYKYVFDIKDDDSNSDYSEQYCYKSSDIRVYLINTSAKYIAINNRVDLADFKKFEEKINEKIKKLEEREKLILSEVNENIKINTIRVDTIDEKDKDRFDKILFKFLEFLAYLIKNIMIWLRELILILFNLLMEVVGLLSGIVEGWVGNKWGNVFTGVVIFFIMLAIILGIILGSPKRNVRIDESDNVNRKTLYSIITALPTDISNAYNDFVKFTGTVNTMLFDAKKTINEMTTESGYFENSELLTDRSTLEYNDSKRVDYIMHFFDDRKSDNNVWHSYRPVETSTKIGTNSIADGIIRFTDPDPDPKSNKKYIITCSDNDYFNEACERKILPNCEDSVSLQETEQQTQPEVKDYTNNYDMIEVDNN